MNTTVLVKVITAAFVVAALVSIVVIGFSKVRYNIMTEKCTATVEGTVIDFRSSHFGDMSVDKTYASYRTDAGVFTAAGDAGFTSVGDKVLVNYDPEKPSRSYVGRPLSGTAYALGVTGLICSVLGGIAINLKPKTRRPWF